MLVLFLNYITPQYIPPPSLLGTALMTPSAEISRNELNIHKFMASLMVRLFCPFYPLEMQEPQVFSLTDVRLHL